MLVASCSAADSCGSLLLVLLCAGDVLRSFKVEGLGTPKTPKRGSQNCSPLSGQEGMYLLELWL